MTVLLRSILLFLTTTFEISEDNFILEFKMKNMSNLTDLIKFINRSPNGNAFLQPPITDAKWEIALSRSVPDWRSVVEDPQNWDKIEDVAPLAAADPLFEALVGAGGMGLAKRWFHSDVSYQRGAAQKWLTQEASVNVHLWQTCNKDMKDALLEHRFQRWPGEPFENLRYVKSGSPFHQAIHFFIIGYVPSPQIQKLRFIVAAAGDEEYLDRIDSMVRQREEACKTASFQLQHRIPYTLNSNERELIARVMEITRRNGYLPTALPQIFVSYETPPIFIAYPELEEEDGNYQRNRERSEDENQIPRNRERRRPEKISIEELLGVYQPQHQRIVIYQRGIKWSKHHWDMDEEWLFSVVLIHEIGHWITHVLPKPGVPAWSTDLFALSETDLKEGWAQLITWWIAEKVKGPFRKTFEELNRNQSPPYHVFEQFKDEPTDKVMASLERLRLLSWPARLQDWKMVLGM